MEGQEANDAEEDPSFFKTGKKSERGHLNSILNDISPIPLNLGDSTNTRYSNLLDTEHQNQYKRDKDVQNLMSPHLSEQSIQITDPPTKQKAAVLDQSLEDQRLTSYQNRIRSAISESAKKKQMQ